MMKRMKPKKNLAVSILALLLVMLCAAIASAAPDPKGVLGLHWGDSEQRGDEIAGRHGLKFTKERTASSVINERQYEGTLGGKRVRATFRYYGRRFFGARLDFADDSETNFFLLRDMLEENYGAATRYAGNAGENGASECYWSKGDVRFSLRLLQSGTARLEYVRASDLQKAMKDAKSKQRDERERMKRALVE
ncbi:hypothetical protein LJC31_08245 [Synergistaceae bacterium OttesenSCG-928-I11]|nr:hypothetical protein [Synergistaceae bacterium OttesenSCG-928-I11]